MIYAVSHFIGVFCVVNKMDFQATNIEVALIGREFILKCTFDRFVQLLSVKNEKLYGAIFERLFCGWNFETSNQLKTYKHQHNTTLNARTLTHMHSPTHTHTDDIVRMTDDPTMLTNCRIRGFLQLYVALCIAPIRCIKMCVLDFKTR